jgi:accessory gene regulator protein AgrB
VFVPSKVDYGSIFKLWISCNVVKEFVMLIRICTRLTECFVQNGILEHSLADWCIYWLQKRILTGLVVSVMLVLGHLLFGLKVTVCFLIGLLPLRRRLNGYHTKSPYTCMVMSVGVMLLALLIHSTFSELVSLIFSIVNFVLCLGLVEYVLDDGQEDLQLHLTAEEVKENHKLAVQVLILESMIGIVIALLLHSVECLSACQLGITVVVLSSACNILKPNKGGSA